jgi:predicted esterase YcpF (UPF0227 family)
MQKNILYLHGLESSPKKSKIEIMEAFADKVTAPQIDYQNYQNKDLTNFFLEQYEKSNSNIIIGSSAGGLAAYILAKYKGCKALLFNPALPKIDLISFKRPEIVTEGYHYKIVLGALDEVIPYEDTLNFLADNEPEDAYNYVILPTLAHKIDEITFKNEIESFMNFF